jgi:hypothetical protein
VIIEELSSRVNLNYDNDLILNLSSVRVKIDDFERGQLALHHQTDFEAFFSVYTNANPYTSDREQLALLFNSKSNSTLPLQVQNAINNNVLMSHSDYFNAIGRDEGLFALANVGGRFNVNYIDNYLLSDILNHIFRLENASWLLNSILSYRANNIITSQTLEAILGQELIAEQPLILAYLGTHSSFYSITIQGKQVNLEAVVTFPYQREKAIIIQRRFIYE